MPGVAGGAFVAARSGTNTNERAEEIVSALLTDIYHAFDFRDDVMGAVEQDRSGRETFFCNLRAPQ